MGVWLWGGGGGVARCWRGAAAGARGLLVRPLEVTGVWAGDY